MTIKQKQHLLAYLGYYVGSVDGIWGTLSETAMNAFKADCSGLDNPNLPANAPEKALKNAVAYDLFKTEPVEEETGTFWDEIEYWTREEFRCQCGGKYCNGFPAEPDENLVRLADNVRAHFGRPGHRSSGLRCKTWNAIQNGVATSYHQFGKALDFRIEGHSAAQVLAYINTLPGVHYAYDIDGTYVHMDVA